jgi:eukaryotic-like serine/threonine-protein kinase
MPRPKIERGATIDGFLIGELIHQGGMALLWEVTRPDISIPLLMKVPNLMEGEDPAAIVGFEMEQMILPRLAGPHVPRFIANGDFSLQPYIVMERIGGETLLNRLKELPLGYEDVAMIGARIAAALDDLHRQHVIHLDLKPSNIMMRPTGEAVLIDFGLSRHVSSSILCRKSTLHGAGAGSRLPLRTPQRSLFAWRAPLFLLNRLAPLRRR